MWEGFLFCPLPSFAHLCAQNPPSPTGKANKKLSTGKIYSRKLFVFICLFSFITCYNITSPSEHFIVVTFVPYSHDATFSTAFHSSTVPLNVTFVNLLHS